MPLSVSPYSSRPSQSYIVPAKSEDPALSFFQSVNPCAPNRAAGALFSRPPKSFGAPTLSIFHCFHRSRIGRPRADSSGAIVDEYRRCHRHDLGRVAQLVRDGQTTDTLCLRSLADMQEPAVCCRFSFEPRARDAAIPSRTHPGCLAAAKAGMFDASIYQSMKMPRLKCGFPQVSRLLGLVLLAAAEDDQDAQANCEAVSGATRSKHLRVWKGGK